VGSVANFCLCYAPAKLEKLTFCSAYFYFGTAILKFDSFSLLCLLPYCTHMNRKGDSLFLSFCTYGISMYQKCILPYTLFPTYLPQPYSPLKCYWRQNSSPTERVGPTRRHNSTGLAKLWGRRLIKLEYSMVLIYLRLVANDISQGLRDYYLSHKFSKL
jgi:hypothetical protein